MRITVLVDDIAPEGVGMAHGFAALVDTPGMRMLFDTGPDGELLLRALEREGAALDSIGLVVLSHSHKDHAGGLARLLYERPRLEVLVPMGSASDIARGLPRDAVVRGEAGPREVASGVLVTGDLGASIPEQALLLPHRGGWAALVGCGHFGLTRVMEAAEGDLTLVVGGLHDLLAGDPALEGVGRVVVCHCTPRKRVLAHSLGNVELGGVGTVVELD